MTALFGCAGLLWGGRRGVREQRGDSPFNLRGCSHPRSADVPSASGLAASPTLRPGRPRLEVQCGHLPARTGGLVGSMPCAQPPSLCSRLQRPSAPLEWPAHAGRVGAGGWGFQPRPMALQPEPVTSRE